MILPVFIDYKYLISLAVSKPQMDTPFLTTVK